MRNKKHWGRFLRFALELSSTELRGWDFPITCHILLLLQCLSEIDPIRRDD